MNQNEYSSTDRRPSTKGLMWSIFGLVVMLVVAGLIVASSIKSIDNEGYKQQRPVKTLYDGMRQSLSNCLDVTSLSISMAERERQTLKDTLVVVVMARQPKGTSAAEDAVGPQFNVLREDYPEVSDKLWSQAFQVAVDCRNSFVDEIKHMQYVAGEFDIWANTGNLFEAPFRGRYPTDELMVTNADGVVLTGQAALDFMIEPILTKAGDEATKTHTMPDQSIPTSTPS